MITFTLREPRDRVYWMMLVDCPLAHPVLPLKSINDMLDKDYSLLTSVQSFIPCIIFVKRLFPSGDL